MIHDDAEPVGEGRSFLHVVSFDGRLYDMNYMRSPSPERTKKLSPWLQHLMKVMKDNNCSLKEATKLASKSYN